MIKNTVKYFEITKEEYNQYVLPMLLDCLEAGNQTDWLRSYSERLSYIKYKKLNIKRIPKIRQVLRKRM